MVAERGTDFEFDFYEGYDLYNSCSITWRGVFYLFGGRGNGKLNTQIVQVNNCGITQLEEKLEKALQAGGCGNVNDEQIYLCFSNNSGSDRKSCVVSENPIGPYTSINKTTYEHGLTRLGASSGRILNKYTIV